MNYLNLKTTATDYVGFGFIAPNLVNCKKWSFSVDWGDGSDAELISSLRGGQNYYNQDGLMWDRNQDIPEEGSIPIVLTHVYDEFKEYSITIRGGYNFTDDETGEEQIWKSNNSVLIFNSGDTPGFCETRPIVKEMDFGGKWAKAFLKIHSGAFKGFTNLEKILRPAKVTDVEGRKEWVQVLDWWHPERGNQDSNNLDDASIDLSNLFSGCENLQPVSTEKPTNWTYFWLPLGREYGVVDIIFPLNDASRYQNKVGNIDGYFEDCKIFDVNAQGLCIEKVTTLNRVFKGVRSGSSHLQRLLGRSLTNEGTDMAAKAPEVLTSIDSLFEDCNIDDSETDYIPAMNFTQITSAKSLFKSSSVKCNTGKLFEGPSSDYQAIDAESMFEDCRMQAPSFDKWPGSLYKNAEGESPYQLKFYWSGFKPSTLKRVFKNSAMADARYTDLSQVESHFCEIVGIHKWDTSECTSLEEAFMGCKNIFQRDHIKNHMSIRAWNVYKVQSFKACFAYSRSTFDITDWFLYTNTNLHGNGGTSNTVYSSSNIDLFYDGSDCSYMFAFFDSDREVSGPTQRNHIVKCFRGLRPSTTEGMFAQFIDKKHSNGEPWDHTKYRALNDIDSKMVCSFGAWHTYAGVESPNSPANDSWKSARGMFFGNKTFQNDNARFWAKSWDVHSVEDFTSMFAFSNANPPLETWFNPNEARNGTNGSKISVKNIDFMFESSDQDLERVKLWQGGMESLESMNGTFKNALKADLSQVGQWFWDDTTQTSYTCNVTSMFAAFQGTINNYDPQQKSGMGLTRYKRFFTKWQLPDNDDVAANYNVHAFLRSSETDSTDSDYNGKGLEYVDGFGKIGSEQLYQFNKNITKDSIFRASTIYPPVSVVPININENTEFLQTIQYCYAAHPVTIYDTVYTNIGVGTKNV